MHIAAKRNDAQVRAAGEDLGSAPQRGRAHDGARRQLVDALRRAGDQDVARVGARQQCRDDEPAGEGRRHVLHRVDREIDGAGQQGLLDLLDEQALAADLGQRPVLDAIARGADQLDADGVGRLQARIRRDQSLPHDLGLRPGQR